MRNYVFIYRKERNNINGNPCRFVTLWEIVPGGDPRLVKANVNEGYIGMWKTVNKLIEQDGGTAGSFTASQLPTMYKGG